MSNQISLSLELICLMNWLLKNERQGLNSLIKSAIKHGFSDELERIDELDTSKVSEQLYSTILDFMILMEQLLMKNLESINLDNATRDAILPTLEKIDVENMDGRTLWLSMQQTKNKLNKSNGSSKSIKQEEAKNILFEQIIKNWKPNKKEALN